MLDFGNSATGCRLVMGAAAGCPIRTTFDGDASLRKRPMQRILDPVTLMGARTANMAEGGGCRSPSKARATRSRSSTARRCRRRRSSRRCCSRRWRRRARPPSSKPKRAATTPKSCSPISAPTSPSRPTAPTAQDFTQGRTRAPRRSGGGAGRSVVGRVPDGGGADRAGLRRHAHRHHDDPLRTGLITTLREMGANIETLNLRSDVGEEMADFRVRASALRGVDVPAERAPSMIDEYPILAVAAAYAEGTTRMRGLKELRVKESDRLAAVADGLKVNGVAVEIEGDDLIVHGKGRAQGGGVVTTHMDQPSRWRS